MGESCATCRFLGGKSGKKAGLFACRRFPPTVHVVVERREFSKDHYKGIAVWSENTGDISMWPMTVLDDWCGEYAARLNGGGA